MKKILIILISIVLMSCDTKDYKTLEDIPTDVNMELLAIGNNVNNTSSFLVIKINNRYGLLEASEQDIQNINASNYHSILSSDFKNKNLKFKKWEETYDRLDKWAESKDIWFTNIDEILGDDLNNQDLSKNNTTSTIKEATDALTSTISDISVNSNTFNTVGDLFKAEHYNIIIKELYFSNSGINVFLANDDQGMWFLLEKPHWHGIDLEEEYTSGNSYDYIEDILSTIDFSSSDKIYKGKIFKSENEVMNYLNNNGFYVGN